MVFELITGDFLFNPRPGNTFKKNDDHLAQFMEVLGPCPKKFAMQGNMFDHYFFQNPRDQKWYFRRIHDLKTLPLDKLLIYRYQMKPKEAEMLADFLMKILKWYPSDRPSAQKMLEHPWLSMPEEYNYRMSDMEFKLYELKDQAQQVDNFEPDMNHLMEQRAHLTNNNQQHHATLDFYQIETLIAKRTESSGNMLYKYPGQLYESDDEINAGDISSELDDQKLLFDDLEDSDIDMSWLDSSDDESFTSDKLIDGYKDFIMTTQKLQLKKEQEEAEKADVGARPSTSKKKKRGEVEPFEIRKRRSSGGKRTRRSTSSMTLSARYDCCKDRLITDDKGQKDQDAAEFDLNISFSGGYVPNTDLIRVDKGQGNP